MAIERQNQDKKCDSGDDNLPRIFCTEMAMRLEEVPHDIRASDGILKMWTKFT